MQAAGEEEEACLHDEGCFIELIIASERVLGLIDAVRAGRRSRAAVLELAAAVQQRPAYAEEARRAGVVSALTPVLSAAVASCDEALLDAASAIIMACSGPMSCGGCRRDFTYGALRVTIQEAALGDGLGAKVWGLAHALVWELVGHPQLVRGKAVLEIGAGCGVAGIAAAKLGAAEVVLSDIERSVLENLARCMELNAGEEEAGAAAAAPKRRCSFDDKQLFDDAEEVEELDLAALLDDGAAAAGPASLGEGMGGGKPQCWSAGNMKVRLLDWSESVQHLDGGGAGGQGGCRGDDGTAAAAGLVAVEEGAVRDGGLPPGVPRAERFAVVLGSEVMYEPPHADLVAAVLAHRLAPGGAGLVCCAVRHAPTFTRFRAECSARGLRCRQRRFEPAAAGGAGEAQQHGIMGHRRDYEGGFLMIAVDHVDAPYPDWHRTDFD